MAEPIIQTAAAGVSIVTLATAVAGPLAGPYLVIGLGAVSGGLWALSNTAETATRIAGAMLMLRCVFTSVLLTALISQLLGVKYGIPVTELYCLVSLVLGAMGNRWQDIFDAVRDLVRWVITIRAQKGSGGGDKP